MTIRSTSDAQQAVPHHARAIYPFVEQMPWALMSGKPFTIDVPGDSILVPEDFEEKTDWMKEFKDLSTIIYQMALGAAAVASF